MQFAFEERGVILLHRVLNRIMLGIKCLNQHRALQLAAPRAPGNLRQQLKGAFRSAKIWQAQRGIGADDTHQRNALKIVSLRQHLRTDKDIQRPARERTQCLLVLPLRPRRIPVQPGNSCAGKFFAKSLFQMLGALSKEIDIFRLALWTLLRYLLDRTAIVTLQPVAVFVMGHRL